MKYDAISNDPEWRARANAAMAARDLFNVPWDTPIPTAEAISVFTKWVDETDRLAA